MEKEFIFEANLTNDKNIEQTLRKILNNWFNNIPNHPHKDLGDNITIKNIFYRPSYKIRLMSQYDERRTSFFIDPYYGKKLEERTCFSSDDINVWDYSFDRPNSFMNKERTTHLENSYYVITCHSCSGKGDVKCGSCSGQGEETCSHCKGKGNIDCYGCRGKGKVSCSWCMGRGYKDNGGNRYDCPQCSGRGEKECDRCFGRGYEMCPSCYGRKKKTCSTCTGKGILTCNTCKGRTELLYHYGVTSKLNYTDDSVYITNPEIQKAFPDFKGSDNDKQFYEISGISNDRLEVGALDNNSLNKFADDFIKKSHQRIKTNNKLLFQGVFLNRLDVYVIEYVFENVEYNILIYGSNYKVISYENPVTLIAAQYLKGAIEASDKRQYSTASAALKKALTIDDYYIQEYAEDALVKIKEKQKSQLRFGALIALLLTLFFGSFVALEYFSEINYVFNYAKFINRPTNFLYNYHVWANIFLFWFLSYKSKSLTIKHLSDISIKTPGAINRFLLGFLATSILASIFFLLICFVNTTGITILLSLALWVVILAFKLIVMLIYLIIELVKWIIGLF